MDPAANKILGVDGGGTKTFAVMVDREGSLVAKAVCAGLDPTANDGWEARLTDLVAPLDVVDAATIGLPFHDEIPEITAKQRAFAKLLIGPHASVVNDVAVAFEGALAGEDGVLILAGTGSMAWARGPSGTIRVGGWGDAFGDEGSAYWIGREALSLVSQHLDGRKPCEQFATGILKYLDVTGEGLLTWAYGQKNPRSAIAAMAQAVSELDRSGNLEAGALMEQAAGHLCALGLTAARLSGTSSPVNWSFAGGVFSDTGIKKSVSALMGTAPLNPRLSPVGGAVLHAARTAGWHADDAFIARLAQSTSFALSENYQSTHEGSK